MCAYMYVCMNMILFVWVCMYIYLCNNPYLCCTCSLNTSQVAQRVKTLGISDSLQSEARFPERMRQYVYPTIEGTDHSRLMYYYTLLVDCAYEGDSISPAQHVALLKKIKSSAPRMLDFILFYACLWFIFNPSIPGDLDMCPLDC